MPQGLGHLASWRMENIWKHKRKEHLGSTAITCHSHISVCTTSVLSNRSQLSPSSEGFPWQRPYILLSSDKKHFSVKILDIGNGVLALWTSCSGTSWLCENIKGISCRSARSSLSFEASSPWKKALLPSKVLVTDTDSICDFSYLANWHTPQLHHNVRLEINDLMVIAWNKSKRKHAQVKLWYVVTSSTLSVDWKGWLIPYQEKLLIPMIFWSWVLGCLWTFPTDLLNHRVTGFKSQKLEKTRIPRNYDTKQNKVKKTCQWAEICQLSPVDFFFSIFLQCQFCSRNWPFETCEGCCRFDQC